MSDDDFETSGRTTNYFKLCSYETRPKYVFFDDRSVSATVDAWDRVRVAIADHEIKLPSRYLSVSVWRRPRHSGPWTEAKVIGENAIVNYYNEKGNRPS